MAAKFIRRVLLAVAVLAASAGSASAQFDAPAGDVIGGEVTLHVWSQVASAIAAGIGGGGYRGGEKFKPAAPTPEPTSAGLITRYFEGAKLGKSAGAKEKKAGAWMGAGYAFINNEFVNTNYDGDILTFVGGGDYRFTDRIVAGVAVSFEDVDIDTRFNNGTIKTSGIGIAPYAVFKLTDKITVDINASYTVLDTDTARTNGAVTGNFDSERYTAAANLNFTHSVDKFVMGSSVGFLIINESQDSYTESNGTVVPQLDISIGQGRLSATVKYNDGTYRPFLSVQLQHEFWAPGPAQLGGGLARPQKSTTGVVLGAGVRFAISESVDGKFIATTTEGREDFSLYSIHGRIRVQF